MKRLILAIAICGAAALAGCDDVRQPQTETAPPAPEAPPVAPAATDHATPAVADTVPTPPPPTDGTVLPPDQRPSEETVKPESETLFY